MIKKQKRLIHLHTDKVDLQAHELDVKNAEQEEIVWEFTAWEAVSDEALLNFEKENL